MRKKEIKGYLTFSISMMLIISACSSKPPISTPIPTKAPIESINPNDINIPGITDDILTPTVDPNAVTPTVDPNAAIPTTDPNATVPTTDPAATATADPAATPTATLDPAATPTATLDPNATPTATLTATPTPTAVPLTCSAQITGDLNAIAGGVAQLTAQNKCSDGTLGADTFTWLSSDVTIATVDSVGKVTGVKAGSVNITASSGLNAAIKTSVQFKVSNTCSIALSGDLKNNPELGLNSAKQLTAAITCNDGSSGNVSWTTSDASIATVGTSGLVEGKKKGNVTITAKSQSDASISVSLAVTVIDPNGNELRTKISENKLHLPMGMDIRNSEIYIAHHDTVNIDEGEVVVYDTSGAELRRIRGSFGDSLPTSITSVVSDGSRVFIANRTRANQSANNLYSYNTLGAERKNVAVGLPSGTDIVDMAIDPSTRTIYVANGLGYVTKVTYDATGAVKANEQQLYFVNGVNPAGVGLDNFGNLFVTRVTSSSAIISKYGKDGNKLLEFSTAGTNSAGPNAGAIGDVAYDGNKGIIYVLAKVGGSNVILRYDSDGKFIRSFGSDAGMINPKSIVVSSDGTLYVSDWGVVSATNDNKGIIHQFGPGK